MDLSKAFDTVPHRRLMKNFSIMVLTLNFYGSNVLWNSLPNEPRRPSLKRRNGIQNYELRLLIKLENYFIIAQLSLLMEQLELNNNNIAKHVCMHKCFIRLLNIT